jgi:hypothetical protein
MEDHKRVPNASELLQGLFDMGEYRLKILGTLANTNVLEELLCYLLMSDAERVKPTADYRFTSHDVQRVLAGAGIHSGARDVADIITNLKVSGIISLAPGTTESYRFSAPRLVDYCLTLDLNRCVEQAMERVRDEGLLETGQKRKKRSLISEQAPEREPASLANQIKHIYLMAQGGIMVTDADGAANFAGSIDPITTDDLNNRCLEVVDHWTNHAVFEQRLRGIGRQLLDAIKLGAPDLIKHLTPLSDRQQVIIVTDSHGLKIPFELLTLDRSNLAIDTAISRNLMNCRCPPRCVPHFINY